MDTSQIGVAIALDKVKAQLPHCDHVVVVRCVGVPSTWISVSMGVEECYR